MTYFRTNTNQRSNPGQPYRKKTIGGTLLIALAMAGFALFKYYSSSQVNPITNETQHISMTVEQEIAIGLQSTPTMIQQYGGLHPDQEATSLVKQTGQRLIKSTIANQSPHMMQILKQASGGNRQPEFTNTHPDPDNRIERIREVIEKYNRPM